MEILNINFEEPLTIVIKGETVRLLAFKTLEHGNVKFGVQAARSIKVHREEIYLALQAKERQHEPS